MKNRKVAQTANSQQGFCKCKVEPRRGSHLEGYQIGMHYPYKKVQARRGDKEFCFYKVSNTYSTGYWQTVASRDFCRFFAPIENQDVDHGLGEYVNAGA